MTIGVQLAALGVAIAVNAAALAAANLALTQIAAREQLAQAQPARIVVTSPRYGESVLATRACAAPGVL